MPRLALSTPRLIWFGLALGLSACSLSTGHAAHEPQSGQLITAAMIAQSGVSTGWDVLRRYANHLTLTEHATNGPVRITRRGRESIYLAESPLLIVDGVKQGDFRALSTLPARDVETMRILTAVEGSTRYGMHAASGVILVRTKHTAIDSVGSEGR